MTVAVTSGAMPSAPRTLEETGLPVEMVYSLVAKTLLDQKMVLARVRPVGILAFLHRNPARRFQRLLRIEVRVRRRVDGTGDDHGGLRLDAHGHVDLPLERRQRHRARRRSGIDVPPAGADRSLAGAGASRTRIGRIMAGIPGRSCLGLSRFVLIWRRSEMATAERWV